MKFAVCQFAEFPSNYADFAILANFDDISILKSALRSFRCLKWRNEIKKIHFSFWILVGSLARFSYKKKKKKKKVQKLILYIPVPPSHVFNITPWAKLNYGETKNSPFFYIFQWRRTFSQIVSEMVGSSQNQMYWPHNIGKNSLFNIS